MGFFIKIYFAMIVGILKADQHYVLLA